MYKLLSMVLAISIASEVAACEPQNEVQLRSEEITQTKKRVKRRIKVRRAKQELAPEVYAHQSNPKLLSDPKYMEALFDAVVRENSEKLKKIEATIPWYVCCRAREKRILKGFGVPDSMV